MERRFTGLRILAIVFKVLGLLVLLVGLLSLAAFAAGLFFDRLSLPWRRVPGFFALFPGLAVAAFFLGSLIQALVLFALGQGIDLLLAMEENTRATATQLSGLARRQLEREASGPGQGAASGGRGSSPEWEGS